MSGKPIMQGVFPKPFAAQEPPPNASPPIQTNRSIEKTQKITKELMNDYYSKVEIKIFSCAFGQKKKNITDYICMTGNLSRLQVRQ